MYCLFPFDEGEKGDLPTFRNIEIPRFDGRFILKEPNTYYISAEIVSVQKYAMSLTRTRLPIYLDLSPEKPRMAGDPYRAGRGIRPDSGGAVWLVESEIPIITYVRQCTSCHREVFTYRKLG